jgi:hypothetical protein
MKYQTNSLFTVLMLKKFTYKFDQGPFATEKELSGNWSLGNCRRALQYYFLL